MRVGSYNRIGVKHALVVEDNTSQVLQIDLVNDSRARRHDPKVVKGVRSPLQELESFVVTLELHLLIGLPRVLELCDIHLDRMVDDQVHRAEGVNLLGIASQSLHSVTHGR